MIRLTRRTTKNDFEIKEKNYWLGEDENSSDKFIEKYPFTLAKGVRFCGFNAYLNKLGAIEDLMERYNIDNLEKLEKVCGQKLALEVE